MATQLHDILTFSRALPTAIVFLSAVGAAEAQLTVYDDFSAARLDETRWIGRQFQDRDEGKGHVLEIQREVGAAQALILQIRTVGGATDLGSFSAENALLMRRSNNVSDIAFDVAIRKLEARGCDSGGQSAASARGVFPLFNDGAGDVVAVLEVGRSSSAVEGELTVSASLVHRSDVSDTILAVLPLGLAALGQPIRLRMRWDGTRSQVRFNRDADVPLHLDYANPVRSAAGRPSKYFAAASQVADCATGSSTASVIVAIDNVRVSP
jgi:hypothetical protein